MEDRPIANWLRQARDAQINPATGEPWTQKHCVDVLLAETDWRVSPALLSRWETGKGQPNRKSLSKLVDFWAKHGVPGPDAAPAPAQATESRDAVADAIDRQTEATRENTVALREQTAMLERVLTILISGVTGGSAQEWASEQIAELAREPNSPPVPTFDAPARPARRPARREAPRSQDGGRVLAGSYGMPR